RFNAKIHAFLSERGIPGSVIYHNTYSDEKANDKNIFAQVNYNQPISKKWQFQANAKANQTSLRDWGLNLNSQYRQHEYYLNATLLYTLSEKCSFSWANDAIRSDIQSRFNISNNEVFAARNTWLSSLAGKYETERLTATARLLYQQTAEENFAYSHLSPYLALSMKVFQSLSARIFYKNTYRIPTFGDIYYPSIPNLNLKAENARQFNLGTTWDTGFAQKRGRFSLSADVYFNRIDNKIISQPHYSMIIWTSVNYGKVDIKGVDFRMDAMFQLKKNFSVEANVNYTCQDVRDKTTEINYQHYNAHLPLTPRHIANSSASLQTPWFNFHYNWMYSGARYTNQSNLFDYWLKPYSEHGFSLSYPFVYHKISGQIALECLNLWNTQYNVIPNYPMPGRSFRLGIKMTY
ncbi:MAG: TonB-dependent receptor, partial [Candidatus Symbiothrix sp.]|nr:TonB-dependent receptor [Candidatus Symbiothrix sp.]